MIGVLGKKEIHTVSDAITAVVADAADAIQSGDQCVASIDSRRR